MPQAQPLRSHCGSWSHWDIIIGYHKETCTLHLWVMRVICQDRCSCSVHHRKAVRCSFGDPTTMNAAASMEAQSNMFVIAWLKEVYNTWGGLILELVFILGALVAWTVVFGFDWLKELLMDTLFSEWLEICIIVNFFYTNLADRPLISLLAYFLPKYSN